MKKNVWNGDQADILKRIEYILMNLENSIENLTFDDSTLLSKVEEIKAKLASYRQRLQGAGALEYSECILNYWRSWRFAKTNCDVDLIETIENTMELTDGEPQEH